MLPKQYACSHERLFRIGGYVRSITCLVRYARGMSTARDHLVPFVAGDPDGRAAEAARKSHAVRRAKRAMVRADAQAVAAHLRTLRDSHERDRLGESCAAAAADLVGRVTRGEIPVRHAGDAAELVRVLVDIARLEAGQPTSASVVAHLTSDAARARLAELRAMAGEVLQPAVSSTAVAAEDGPPAREPDGAGEGG
jgi:hypothetical protein